MSSSHYKLPLDEDVDKDIMDWINSFHRTKKGEMVRHAIRYYMSVLEEGETIKFPNMPSREVERKLPQAVQNKKERKRPQLNADSLK